MFIVVVNVVQVGNISEIIVEFGRFMDLVDSSVTSSTLDYVLSIHTIFIYYKRHMEDDILPIPPLRVVVTSQDLDFILELHDIVYCNFLAWVT